MVALAKLGAEAATAEATAAATGEALVPANVCTVVAAHARPLEVVAP